MSNARRAREQGVFPSLSELLAIRVTDVSPFPGTRERFEDFVFASYARLNEERRGILEDIRRRGRIHA